MPTLRARPRRVAGFCLPLVALLACHGDNRQGGNFVNMYDNAFNAAVVRVPVGVRVKWINVGKNVHNAVSTDGSWSTGKPGAMDLAPGHEQDLTFDAPGVYHYYCTYHGTKDGKGMAGVVVVGNAEYHPGARGAIQAVAEATGVIRRVPKSYPTIQAAVDAADPGDLVLVDKGIYREEVTVTTPSITIRGADRNETIIDGEFVRGNGIAVLADGVALENLTARNAFLTGFYWTGITGFRGSYLTAYNNGDYGIYAFDATDGLIEHAYASGSPDSGFYIGECYPCRIVIRDVISEHNAIGYSGTNSGGDLYVVSSIWRNNRSGLVPASLDLELKPPQRETVIAANLVVGNSDRSAPAAALPALAFGNGVLIGGGIGNIVERNIITDHEQHGILVTPMFDRNFWPARKNIVRDNQVVRSGRADLALGGPSSSGNCFSGNRHDVGAPAGVQLLQGCGGLRLPIGYDPLPILSAVFFRGAIVASRTFPDWRGQPVPPPQEDMALAATAPAHPAVRVFESLHFNVAEAQLPPGAEHMLAGAAAGASPVSPPGVLGRLLGSATFWLPPLLLVVWIWSARRARRIGRRWARAWVGGFVVVLLVYLAVLATATVVYAAF
jgi:plastocyanin